MCYFNNGRIDFCLNGGYFKDKAKKVIVFPKPIKAATRLEEVAYQLIYKVLEIDSKQSLICVTATMQQKDKKTLELSNFLAPMCGLKVFNNHDEKKPSKDKAGRFIGAIAIFNIFSMDFKKYNFYLSLQYCSSKYCSLAQFKPKKNMKELARFKIELA